MSGTTTIPGLLLAAGAGRRAGGPKALRRDSHGVPWVVATAKSMKAAGCAPVIVATGCEHEQVGQVLDGEDVLTFYVDGWQSGLSASLRAGLREAIRLDSPAVLIHLVDLPGVGPAAIRRVLSAEPVTPATLHRASYAGQPGHPVLIGSAHYQAVLEAVSGDAGAGSYLNSNGAALVPCDDLADGADADHGDEPAEGGHAWDRR
jgi:CTP:molybdopterin cytidylyltransferase MocA